MKTSATRNSINRSPPGEFLLILFVFACFALAPRARAICQEGCLTNENTVLGDDALLNNTAIRNTAIGFNALTNNTGGVENTATGWNALASNRNGIQNPANGTSALYSNTSGAINTAIGFHALYSNTTGTRNTATGSALSSNMTGHSNTATGVGALANNTTGDNNTATGDGALAFNTTSSSNTANGFGALGRNGKGSRNTAVGVDALSYNETGNNNIALGFNAGRHLMGDNNIDIGNPGVRDERATIRIGTSGTHKSTFVAGISEATVAGGVGVIIDTNGQLGTIVSSARFKDAIKSMDKASEAILGLKPVSFRYKPELDPEGIPQFGLVAEEVEKVNPDLVVRDKQGKPHSVRYDQINVMLLNEFLKEHRKMRSRELRLRGWRSRLRHSLRACRK